MLIASYFTVWLILLPTIYSRSRASHTDSRYVMRRWALLINKQKENNYLPRMYNIFMISFKMESAPKKWKQVCFYWIRKLSNQNTTFVSKLMLNSLELSIKHTIEISTSWARYSFLTFQFFQYIFKRLCLLPPIQFRVSHFPQIHYTFILIKKNTSTSLEKTPNIDI
jgi:hypothetical protein